MDQQRKDRDRLKELVYNHLTNLLSGETTKQDVVDYLDELIGDLLSGKFGERFYY